jgi:hypothetical protein
MDELIEKLRAKGQVEKRGGVDCLILSPRQEVQPGVFVESYIPVEDFKTIFPTADSLKNAPPEQGYAPFAQKLQKEGML